MSNELIYLSRGDYQIDLYILTLLMILLFSTMVIIAADLWSLRREEFEHCFCCQDMDDILEDSDAEDDLSDTEDDSGIDIDNITSFEDDIECD